MVLPRGARFWPLATLLLLLALTLPAQGAGEQDLADSYFEEEDDAEFSTYQPHAAEEDEGDEDEDFGDSAPVRHTKPTDPKRAPSSYHDREAQKAARRTGSAPYADLDEDEFDFQGIQKVKQAEEQERKAQKAAEAQGEQAAAKPWWRRLPGLKSLAPTPRPIPKREGIQDYTNELMASAVVLLFIFNYVTGKSANQALARHWLRSCRDVFHRQFAFVGTSEKPTPSRPGPELMRENPSTYKFWASGRVNCEYCLVTIDLRKRQDLFARAWELLFPQRDTVTLEIGLLDDAMGPGTMAIAKCGRWDKQLKGASSDIERFCDPIPLTPHQCGLDSSLSVTTDMPEMFAKSHASSSFSYVPDTSRRVIHANLAEFIHLHISDGVHTERLHHEALVAFEKGEEEYERAVKLGRRALVMKCLLPDSLTDEKRMNSVKELITLALNTVDIIARSKPPMAVVRRVTEKRAKVRGEEDERRMKAKKAVERDNTQKANQAAEQARRKELKKRTPTTRAVYG